MLKPCCAKCAHTLEPWLADLTRIQFGRPLCIDCMPEPPYGDPAVPCEEIDITPRLLDPIGEVFGDEPLFPRVPRHVGGRAKKELAP